MSACHTYLRELESGKGCYCMTVQTVENSIMSRGKKMPLSYGLGEEVAKLQLLDHRCWREQFDGTMTSRKMEKFKEV